MRPRCGLALTRPRAPLAAAAAALLLAACASPSPSPTPSIGPSATAEPSSDLGQVVPAPGSDSRIFAPNPAAIVVAIDPGHGGCLDWGVPNPYDNTVARSEKTLTLAIARVLRDRLEADGVRVVMTRDADLALAGDLYPPLGCEGDPFRDVNGDGDAGFGPEVPEATRTRDELSARIDLVNLARADALLAIHVNSLTENGAVIEVAATETFWTDETPWGMPQSERLARLTQDEVVAAMAAIATYPRQDRGIEAVNYYVIAPPTETGDPREPRRGIFMPGVLTEVGSMSLEAEADLLATPAAQAAIADALFAALVRFFAERPQGIRLDTPRLGYEPGVAPAPVPGEGPMYWPPAVSPGPDGTVRLAVTLTNSGTASWPVDGVLMAGWVATDDPYPARQPGLQPLDAGVPPLAPGESVTLEVELPDPPAGSRAVAWITLDDGGGSYANRGLAPLLLAVEP
jgi:N-acetylmuramoyl-L-alanine amidase